MLIFLSILVVLLGFIFQSNKNYTWVMLIWMWILFAFNTMNADYLAYERIYYGIAANNTRIISNYEELFVLMCRVGSQRFHWNYQQFVVFLASISIVLFAVVIKLYCGNKRQNLVISLFILFLYGMFICQYRTYISLLLVLIGLWFLRSLDGWRGDLLFLGFVVLGITVHRMAALCILFLATKHINKKQITILIPIVMALILVLRNPSLSAVISRYVPGYKMDRWLYSDGNRTMVGIIMLIVVRLFLVLFENYCYGDKTDTNIAQASLNELEFIVKVSMMSLVFLPFEMLQDVYERMARLPLFLSFVFYAVYIDNTRIDRHHMSWNVTIYGAYFMAYMVYFYISFHGWFLNNLIPVFTCNSLIPC